jgi:hypothetical protein
MDFIRAFIEWATSNPDAQSGLYFIFYSTIAFIAIVLIDELIRYIIKSYFKKEI